MNGPIRTCRDCVEFDDDPAAIEAWIPNFTMLGSAYSSSRGIAGICRAHNRILDPAPAASCPAFEPRGRRPRTTQRAEATEGRID